MSFLSRNLSSVFFRFKNQRSRSLRYKPKRDSLFNFQQLESRELLASINLNAAGELIISGDAGNDVGQIINVSSTTVRASITGVPNQDFNAASISEVIFIGFAGNDRFTNSTSINSRLIGGDGDDTLGGGSGDDIINGGTGDDNVAGNDGNDRLIGFNGADTLRGGNGDDVVLGGDGANRLFGDAGNDLIIGGADVDELFGGEGNDVLVGLDGDDILDVGNGGVDAPGNDPNADQPDLALGFEGNDTLRGGNGLNVLYGGDGDDIIRGGGDVNRFHGQDGNDTLTGGAGDDFLAAQNGDDIIFGAAGNDFILPGQGDDTVNGGNGNDRVVLPALESAFNVFSENSTVGVTGSGQGFDKLTNTELLRFSDNSEIQATSQATRRVTVQPIVVANSNGSNRAEFFGNAEQALDIQLRVDNIFAAAGIDIDWRNSSTFNNTTANNGGSGSNTLNRLESITTAGDAARAGSASASVIDMYFVNQTPVGESPSDLSANGFAFIDSSGIAFRTGSTLVTTSDFRDLVAQVAAHEIAHNLGLAHTATSSNLMFISESGLLGNGTNISSTQINSIRNSGFAQTLGAAGAVSAQDPATGAAGNTQADPAGGCGGCGVCGACTGA